MNRWGSICACVALVGSVSCGGEAGPSDPAPMHDVVQLATAVFDVRALGCGPQPTLGVATLIDDGLAVTAAHVVAGADVVQVVGDDDMVDASVVFFDPLLDVAALRFAAPGAPPVPVTEAGTRRDEAGVVALPTRDRDAERIDVVDVAVIRSVTIRTSDITRSEPVSRSGFEIGATITVGDSGALVVVDGFGIGVVWARSTVHGDRAWAVALPGVLRDPSSRAMLSGRVDTGDCV